MQHTHYFLPAVPARVPAGVCQLPPTRAALRESWGFCRQHAWQLQELEAVEYGDGLKHAIVYEWMLRLVASAIQQVRLDLCGPGQGARRWWRRTHRRPESALTRRQQCPACLAATQSERLYLAALVQGLGDDTIRSAYLAGDGLCLPHFAAAMELNVTRERLLELCEMQLARVAALREQLAAYVDKHDYRNTTPCTAAELRAWIDAVQLMAGNRDTACTPPESPRPPSG
ncbi:MAG: DUF6062 family protein [Syntrophomonadaceae bacterium]|nr:DUF6062 family protein [Syntrophomonadaceae bacterium]MDH7497220.1 DUF6062 family protein [Syntrophomonadaceae bacterium]